MTIKILGSSIGKRFCQPLSLPIGLSSFIEDEKGYYMSKSIMVATNASDVITSLELVDQINMFRGEDVQLLKHNDLLKVIRDEFEEEIRESEISLSQYSYKMPTGGMKNSPMFLLTLNQAKQVLVRESKKVRKAVIKYIETLEAALNTPKTVEQLKDELLLAYEKRDLEQQRSIQHGYKSVIGRKNSIIKGSMDELGVDREKDVVTGIKHLKDDYYTATVVGKTIGLSARSFNKELKDNGYQDKIDGVWVATTKGKPFSIQHKQNVDGTVRYSVRWLIEVIEDMDI